MGIYVYPTDERWFQFLRARAPIDEVNFWQPGGRQAFGRLRPGELFLFRLKGRINRIAGGGIFRHASLYPISAAWEAFQEKNGVANFGELWEAIERYRRKSDGESLRPDSQIGCIILESPFFLPESYWIDVPADYSANLVQGKRFSLESPSGATLHAWAAKMLRMTLPAVREPAALVVPGAVYGDPALRRPRLGQGAFRVMVADAYSRRCAVTGEKTLPVLEAAHIKPVSAGGEHRMDNGLLLRSDIHKLFDLGYVTVTPQAEFRVSPSLRETWLNGRVYYELDRRPARIPEAETMRPSKLLLEWHNDTVFRR